jgi:mRNA deadenylase, exonuclease subunit and related nucleases
LTRERHANQVIESVKKKTQKYTQKLAGKNATIGKVICGDFNTKPNSSLIKIFRKSLGLSTVFGDVKYTFWHYFPLFLGINAKYKRTVDYVLYSDNLEVIKKLEGPKDEVVGDKGLLSEQFPSDHLDLYCEFAIR